MWVALNEATVDNGCIHIIPPDSLPDSFRTTNFDSTVVMRDALRAMLKQGAPPPEGRFADLAVLAPVKDYPPRHASTMLAFEATAEAVRQALAGRRAAEAERTSRAGAA